MQRRMEVPETPAGRIEWFQRQVGRELKSRVETPLAEYQSAVDGVSVQSGAKIEDILIGGSFLDADTDSPKDLDIGVVTDTVPSESVTDGFWRFINDQTVLDIPLDVDCVWIRSASEIANMREQPRQYSVQAAEAVSIAEYAEPATGAHS